MNAPVNTAALLTLAPQEISIEALGEKYAKGTEKTIEDIQRRVAKALALAEPEHKRESTEALFMWALQAGFVPAGRIWSAAGTSISATLMNCFVQPVGDSMSGINDGKPGIYTALMEASETMRRGGGVGYDFSAIRPEGALVNATQSRASGPVSFMGVFDKSCETVESAGQRRGAQMAVLRCEHPDIKKFIAAKRTGGLTNFNMSIGVTDAFMRAVEAGENFQLVHKAAPHSSVAEGKFQREDGMWVYEEINAKELYKQFMESTYNHAEPGILFIDRMNEENNLWYCEIIEATNPCAEEPLPSYGCCDLGSVNLTKLVRNPFTSEASFDFDLFARICAVGTRMLDNVLDVTFWPLPQQKAESDSKRRIGQGFLGLGSALAMLGLRYDSEEGRAMAAKISEAQRDACYLASADLAVEKGAFPLFDADKYLESGFCKRLPESIREVIRTKGMRNSHTLAIAPTGTIALAFADNASNGIEPPFQWQYTRNKRMADGTKQGFRVYDHAFRMFRAMFGEEAPLPASFVTALEMSADAHMRMLEVVQPFMDTSISKTVNIPADYPFEDFSALYLNGWKAGLKGLATYRPNATLGAVLVADAPAAAPAAAPAPAAPAAPVVADIDPLRVSFAKRPTGELNSVTEKVELSSFKMGKRSVYVTVSFAKVDGIINGKPVTIERPLEIFLNGAKRDAGQQWMDYSTRAVSLIARDGGSLALALENMREVTDIEQVRSGFYVKADGTQVPRNHDSDVAALGYAIQQMLIRRGYLTEDGRQVPAAKLAAKAVAPVAAAAPVAPVVAASAPEVDEDAALRAHYGANTGAKCSECGNNDVHHIDGCSKCLACGVVGACG